MKRLWVILPLLFFFSCEDKKDTTPPETTITSPSSGSTVNEAVNVTCMSTDNEEVSKVELWVDGVNTGLTDDTEPYSFIWNTTTYKDGDHTLIVRGYDTSDNEGDSPPITVKVDNTISVPKSVSVQSAVFSNGGFTIKWSKATDGDFQSYTLEHSVESQMNDYEEIFTTEDVNVTNTRMENVSPLTFHYFRVTVTDTFDYQTKGLIYSTSLDPVPDSVDVDTVTYDIEKMTVKWGESKESDFGSYKLLYSKTESGDKDTVETYTDKSTTSYSTTTYDPTHENWYWVMVSDTLGQSTVGNGKTNTIDTPPSSIHIKSVTYDVEKMIVEWDGSSDWDFKEYKLLYSLTQNGNKDTLKSYTDIKTTSYTTTTFDPTQENWYFIEVTDYFGQKTIGNGKTNTIDSPPTVTDIDSTVFNNSDLYIYWTVNTDDDFSSLTVYESNSKDMSNSTVVFSSQDQTLYRADVYNYPTDVKRYYQIEVKDKWGLKSQSAIVTVSTMQKIVFIREGQGVFTMDIEGDALTTPVKPYWSGNSSFYPQFSPDGKKIIYVTNARAGNTYNIFIMNVDGSEYTRLSQSQERQKRLRFSPDGTKIVFYWKGDESNTDIYLMNLNNPNDIVRLTDNDKKDMYPVFSPDGNKVLFKTDRDGDSEIYIMDIDGSNQTNLTKIDAESSNNLDINIEVGTGVFWQYKFTRNGSPPTDATYPLEGTWSMRREAGALGVGPALGDVSWWANSEADVTTRACFFDDEYVFNKDGSFKNVLGTETWLEAWQAGVDADGCGAPVAPHDGSNAATWSVDETAGTITIVGSGAFLGLAKAHNTAEDGFPVDNKTVYNYTLSAGDNADDSYSIFGSPFSPDGSKIVFSSNRTGYSEVYIMDIDGNNQTRLTNNDSDDFAGMFTPDGNKIVFASRRDNGDFEIYIMDIDGSNQTNLTNSVGHDYLSQISYDGKKILFVSGRDGVNQIYMMNIDGSNQINLTNDNENNNAPHLQPRP